MFILLSIPGFIEIIIILVLIIFLFGAKKIPGIARGIGKSMKHFNDAKEGKADDEKTMRLIHHYITHK